MKRVPAPMPAANEALFDVFVRHQTGLLRPSGGIRNHVHKLTDATEDDVVAQITRRLSKSRCAGRARRDAAL